MDLTDSTISYLKARVTDVTLIALPSNPRTPNMSDKPGENILLLLHEILTETCLVLVPYTRDVLEGVVTQTHILFYQTFAEFLGKWIVLEGMVTGFWGNGWF